MATHKIFITATEGSDTSVAGTGDRVVAAEAATAVLEPQPVPIVDLVSTAIPEHPPPISPCRDGCLGGSVVDTETVKSGLWG